MGVRWYAVFCWCQSKCVRVREWVRERGRGRWEIVSSLWVDHQSTNYIDGRRCGQVEVSAGVWHILVIVSGLIGQSGIFPWKPLDSYRNRWPMWCRCFLKSLLSAFVAGGRGLSEQMETLERYGVTIIVQFPHHHHPCLLVVWLTDPTHIWYSFWILTATLIVYPPFPMHACIDWRQTTDSVWYWARLTCRDLQIDHTKPGICHCKILTRFGVLAKKYNR